MRAFRVTLYGIVLSFFFTQAAQARNDVLIVVNDNSVDSPQVGQHYAQQRGVDPGNVVHVRVPNQYYIGWTDFQSLRDQILRFGICPSVDVAVRPIACSNAGIPIYTAATVAALTASTPIRYIVTTRGVPTRMTVDNSPYGGESTSVDNYLKYWLARFISSEVSQNAPPPPYNFPPPSFALDSTARAAAFDDGRGMRIVNPITDGEYIIGRIDGVNLAAAKALIDRALYAESNGWYGKLYGSTFGNTGGYSMWTNYGTNRTIYGDLQNSWRYAFGLLAEARSECSDYESTNHYFVFAQNDPRGKTPSYCYTQFNKGMPNETIPGVSTARQPKPVDALVYFGSLDGHTMAGAFASLQNWRKNDACNVTLCSNAADPAACRAASIDPYRELNTDCVGVAPGFIGYNFQSFPVSIFGNWPTSWGPASIDQNDVPVVVDTDGTDDNYSAWFYQPDEVVGSSCYVYANGVLGTTQQTCGGMRKIGLIQSISATSPDANNPPAYRLSFYTKGRAIPSAATVTSQILFTYPKAAGTACPTGLSGSASDTSCSYGPTFKTSLQAGDSGWALVGFDVTPPINTGMSYSTISIKLSGAITGGRAGFDGVSLKTLASGTELVSNGSFAQGHRQTANGDYAANFLGRLGGTAFWGSLSHHESGGHSFDVTSLGTLIYFIRGLPLGDAVWLGEKHVSGIFYGDPLYSPVAVKFNHLVTDSYNRITGSPLLLGSTINGRDTSKVSTTYRVDYCPGKDFFVCDRQQTWLSTNLSGQGGRANQQFGIWNIGGLPFGEYTLRLAVSSTNGVLGKTQTLNDYYVVRNRYSADEIPTYTISGTIKDTGGQPMAGVTVTVCCDSDDNVISTTTTNANGYYSLGGLGKGSYVVSPSAVGYVFSANGGAWFQAINNASVTKNYTGSSSGSGYFISGTIKDTGGQPMAGVTVTVCCDSDDNVISTTTTNANGYYSLGGVTKGWYVVSPSAVGYAFSANGGAWLQAISNSNVTKNYTGSSSSGSRYFISGTIKDTGGRPMAGVTVTVCCDSNNNMISTTATNANGFYSLGGLTNGWYAVSPSAVGYAFSANGGAWLQAINNASVTKNYTATLNVQTYSISGFILTNGQPLAGASVRVSDALGFMATTTTNASGYYFQAGLKNGTYRLSPSKAGYSFTGSSSQQIYGGNIISKNFSATPLQ